MNFRFSIEYRTQWGEELRLHIEDVDYEMYTNDGVIWEVSLELAPKGDTLSYYYSLYRQNRLVWREWESCPHTLHLKKPSKVKSSDITYSVEDFWRPIPNDLPLYSSAYTDVAGRHTSTNPSDLPTYKHTLQLRIIEPRLRQDEWLGICGNCNMLGNWEHPLKLSLTGVQEWSLNLNLEDIYQPIEYKYVILDSDGNIKLWEEGDNRTIGSVSIEGLQHTWVKTERMALFNTPKWKCAGVVIPVFSLRTEKSFGVGDFSDLKSMISWAASVGMHVVQILPINDTMMTGSWRDSYPYNSISIYAFHPIYADIRQLPKLDDPLSMEKFLMRQQELNRLPSMDYESVIALKMDYFRRVYAQEGEKVLKSKDYGAFFEHNKSWLVPYAVFSYLRDTYGTPDFRQWRKLSVYNKSEVGRLSSPRSKHYQGIALYYYIQYQLHLQLTEVHNHAHRNGVIIKGDIPIGISPNSVEAWSEPHLFNMDCQAGAPPDAFSVNGQNWGFPTYNWREMSKDGYSWWRNRFKKMSEYFDAYRIDHVLGFFRIWEIPSHSVHGLLGNFSPALPLSQSEIASYGFHFNRKVMTQPYINDDILYSIFGYRSEMVKMLYLDNADDITCEPTYNAFGGVNGLYRLKREYDTQRKIESAFSGKTDEESITLRDGLYSLASNVLFVVDKDDPHGYHPRIIAQQDYAYRYLSESDQRAFNALYEDYYYHRHNDYWYDEAMKKLPMLTQCTRMLVCAEDLGMVPSCVPVLMSDLRILSLEIQTMPKAFGVEFGVLSENPYLSVATISTHDMAPLRQWWEEDEERAQRYFNQSLGIDGPAPNEMPGWLCEKVVSRHLYSPSMLCLLSLQDWLSIDESVRYPDANGERINIPANPRHYWRWRMHLTIEELCRNKSLCKHIHELITRSCR